MKELLQKLLAVQARVPRKVCQPCPRLKTFKKTSVWKGAKLLPSLGCQHVFSWPWQCYPSCNHQGFCGLSCFSMLSHQFIPSARSQPCPSKP